ncbi:MAG: disulfide bond formation protein B [Limnohabitans sp.]|jgi:disulfide bond formation protein DsbB|nr:disulfide bond formation protein B [Limnohabitans sp.]
MTLFRLCIAITCILATCAVLLGALWAQFGQGEFPCPLCIIQRMAMMLAALGPAWLLCRAARGPVDAHDFAQCYACSILAALVGGTVSARQVLLHIAPGDPGYGAPMFGMHLYTWAFVVFVVVVLASAMQMLFLPKRSEAPRVGLGARLSVLLLGAIIAVNAVAVFVESGFHWYLPDNPTSNRLIEELRSEVSEPSAGERESGVEQP